MASDDSTYQQQYQDSVERVAKLNAALERYYQQDVQLYALVRSLRSLEQFNASKAQREHVPYRTHLANAYGAQATAIERIVSKQDSGNESPLSTFADSLVRLIEEWRKFADPFELGALVPYNKLTEYGALCKKTFDLITGGQAGTL